VSEDEADDSKQRTYDRRGRGCRFGTVLLSLSKLDVVALARTASAQSEDGQQKRVNCLIF
jgi:hypothetical protein